MRKLLHLLHRLHLNHTASTIMWLTLHVGRRGSFLAFLCLLDIIYGYSLAAPSLTTIPPSDRIWVWVWMVGAVNAASGVFLRKDRIQFAIAATLKSAWALYEFYEWAYADYTRGWIVGVIWISFAAIILLIASWPEIVITPPVASIEPVPGPKGDDE